MRNCPFNGCKAVVPDHIFACRRHWLGLSRDQKAEVYECYYQYVIDEISMDELRQRQQAVLDATRIGGKA